MNNSRTRRTRRRRWLHGPVRVLISAGVPTGFAFGRGVGSVLPSRRTAGRGLFGIYPFRWLAWLEADFEALLRGANPLPDRPSAWRGWSFPRSKEASVGGSVSAGIDSLAWNHSRPTTRPGSTATSQISVTLLANSKKHVMGCSEVLRFFSWPGQQTCCAARIIPRSVRTKTSPAPELKHSPDRHSLPPSPNRVGSSSIRLASFAQEVNRFIIAESEQSSQIIPAGLESSPRNCRWDHPRQALHVVRMMSGYRTGRTGYPLQHGPGLSCKYWNQQIYVIRFTVMVRNSVEHLRCCLCITLSPTAGRRPPLCRQG